MKYIFRFDILIMCALVFGSAYALFFLPLNMDVFNPLKLAVGDFDITDMVKSHLTDHSQENVDTSIVLVNIGSANREQIATMIQRISTHSPKVIGIDAFFRNPKTPEGDSLLASAIARAGNIIMGNKVVLDDTLDEFTSVEQSNIIFHRHALKEGFLNVITDDEVSFRTVREFSAYEIVHSHQSESTPDTVLNFSLCLAQAYRPNSIQALLKRNNETEIIDFRGNINHFFALDIDQVLDSSVSLEFLHDKVILMGYMGEHFSEHGAVTSFEDVFFTPLNPQYAGKSFPDMYGVVVHANIVSQILSGTFYTQMSSVASSLLSIFFCLANLILFTILSENESRWYDVVTILGILFQTIFLTYLSVYMYATFKYKMDITLTLATLVLTPTIHEIYNETIVPLLTEFWQFLKGKFMKSVKNPLAAIIAIASLFLLTHQTAFTQTAALKVMAVRGKVTVTKSGKTSPAKVGTKLMTQDKITVADKSSISLLHPSGRAIELTKQGTIVVSDILTQAQSGSGSISKKFASYVYNEITETSGAPSTSHKKNMSVTGSVERAAGESQGAMDVLEDVLVDVGAVDESSTNMSGVAALKAVGENIMVESQVNIIVPHSTYLLEPKVRFVWNQLKGADSYDIFIMTNSGTVLHKQTVRDTTVYVDLRTSNIQPGTNYYWHVEQTGKSSTHSTEYIIHLHDDKTAANYQDTLKMIDSENPGGAFSKIIKAQFAEDAGLHTVAIDNYQTAIRQSTTEDYARYFRNYLRRTNVMSIRQR